MINWYTVTIQILQDFVRGLLPVCLKIIGAIIVFVIGYIISVVIGKLITGILKKLKFNRLFEKEEWQKALGRAEIKVDPAGFIGAIFKWVLVIVFLLAAVEISGLPKFADFLKAEIVPYLGNVIVAALIFVVAIVIADILEKIVRATVEKIKTGYAQLAGAIVKWAIWIFAIFAILIQLKVASALIQTLWIGFVGLIVIAGGIAFGLGGKDVAAELLESLRKKLKE